jgi:hypothetical protein
VRCNGDLRYRSAVAAAARQQKKDSSLIYRVKCSGTKDALFQPALGSGVITTGSHTKDAGRAIAVVSDSRSFWTNIG